MEATGILADLSWLQQVPAVCYNLAILVTALGTFVTACAAGYAAVRGHANGSAIAEVKTLVNGQNDRLQAKVDAQAEQLAVANKTISNTPPS